MSLFHYNQDGELDAVPRNIIILATIIAVVVILPLLLRPIYRVWSEAQSGKAALREAEWSRQIQVEEAKALAESARLRAEAEIERAKGVAEANRIIGDSLNGNEAYLRYLWIQGLNDGTSEVIYVPTEAGLPILEAGKR